MPRSNNKEWTPRQEWACRTLRLTTMRSPQTWMTMVIENRTPKTELFSAKSRSWKNKLPILKLRSKSIRRSLRIFWRHRLNKIPIRLCTKSSNLSRRKTVICKLNSRKLCCRGMKLIKKIPLLNKIAQKNCKRRRIELWYLKDRQKKWRA